MVSRRVPNCAGRVIDKTLEFKKKAYFYGLRKRCGMYRLTGAVNQAIFFYSCLFIFFNFLCMSFNLTQDKPVSDPCVGFVKGCAVARNFPLRKN